jgi:hypothetical protein
MFKKLGIVILLMTSISTFSAEPITNSSDMLIKSVSVEEVSTPSTVIMDEVSSFDPVGSLNEISLILDGLLGIGKKIWPIIEGGKPVVTTNLAPAVSIIPNIDGKNVVLNDMANWSIPKVKSYRVAFQNYWGNDVVAFTYTVIFQHGGSYNNVGKYVTTLKVIPSDIYTSWGFNFNVTSELVGISNVGSKESPIASGVVQVSYKVTSVLNDVSRAQSFYIDGNGNINVL